MDVLDSRVGYGERIRLAYMLYGAWYLSHLKIHFGRN